MNSLNNSTTTVTFSGDGDDTNDDVKMLKILTYRIWLPFLVGLGIFGNVLNLITLRSSTLQNIPFMYIRAIAVFDLLCLPLVGLACSRLWQATPKFSYHLTFYQAHIERPLINVLLTASLFTALMLTVERYYLICKPHNIRRTHNVVNPRLAAKLYIFFCLLMSTVLHVPMLFEKVTTCTSASSMFNVTQTSLTCSIKDNRHFSQTLLKTSRLTRELVCRFLPVILLAFLNAIIVKTLQKLKHRRRQMTLKSTTLMSMASSPSTEQPPMETITKSTSKRRSNSYLGSFTEKRLTTMMMAITVIYVVGNVPQSISMIMNDDSRGDDFVYQLFRSFANTMEICHHCLNFYIFCLTSRDYSKSFLRHCSYVKRFLVSFVFRRFGLRRSSIDAETTSIKPPGELSILLFQDDDFVFMD